MPLEKSPLAGAGMNIPARPFELDPDWEIDPQSLNIGEKIGAPRVVCSRHVCTDLPFACVHEETCCVKNWCYCTATGKPASLPDPGGGGGGGALRSWWAARGFAYSCLLSDVVHKVT